MSVTMTKADGVTVFTLTTDPKSPCPPLCQILAGFCYSPVCCSVSQQLKRIQTSQSALAALQITIGLLNIGLGAILSCSGGASSWQMDSSGSPYWLGGMFILFGITNILSDKFPSPCLVILNVILNLTGVCFAIAAIVLYSINIADIYLYWMCHDEYGETTLPPYERRKCLEGEELVLMLMRGINGLLIVLSVMELCVTISSAVLGIKALKSFWKENDKSSEEPELYSPLLDGGTGNPAV